MDRMALIPDVHSPAAALGILIKDDNFSRLNVRPMHYLAIDEVLDQNEVQNLAKSANYIQVRKIMARDEYNERESIRDLPNHGVASFSPFHLADFMPGRRDVFDHSKAINAGDSIVSLMRGSVVGTLSTGGGMHRIYQQRITLSLNEMQGIQSFSSSKRYRMEINATILLPLMESIFIDADDPIIVEYNAGSPDPILCRAFIHDSNINDEKATSTSSCNVQFVSPETIDIEQPSFASRQYVVAFHINASLVFGPDGHSLTKQLNIGLDYGTTIHTRYQLPQFNHQNNASHEFTGMNGTVLITVQQPVLYSSIISVMERTSNDPLQYFVLDTHASSVEKSKIPQPIVISVAIGVDNDYWWVTSITMLSALVGGFVVMRSIDSVSTWN
ncbi:hypothetical protein ACHAWO_012645 [Cyclotella atomus]|uniref:Uncharacterized protein n=1 Tax=Cyclotella atomus TaxID=382360 RepID=A0ABD3N8J0_9STRA